ncbi:hypothetical protein ACHAQA_001178 [Verticillium albo-atrum]
MATDLASPVGLSHPDEEEYIDYSDDEPETSPIKPTADSTSYFESVQPADLVPESEQDFSAEAADLTTVNIDSAAPQVANTAFESLPQSDAVLADGIQHDDPASIEQAVQPSGDHLADNEISWDEDEDRNEPYEEEEHMQHESTGHPAAEEETLLDTEPLSTGPGFELDAEHHSTTENHHDSSAQEVQPSAPQELSRDSIDDADEASKAANLHAQEHDDLNEIDYEEDDALAVAPEQAGLEVPMSGDDDAESFDPSVRDNGDQETGDHEYPANEPQADVESVQEPVEPSSIEETTSHESTADDAVGDHEPDEAVETFVENEAMAADSSAASLDTPEEEDAEMPVVTVLWHGVEYPLFYNSVGSEGRDCFFHDLSVLQCKMEELLASLRRVLADDVADRDELVLQVEELGLEFAESSHPDQFSEITLGSILQVFDHLVKNKDPEATRPMYALLITRPNCSKRWSSLIEDAWNGKNIDEISYSFSAREQDAIDEAEVEAEDAEMFLHQDDLDDEMGDDFGDLVEQENPADDEPENSYNESGDVLEPANMASQETDALDGDALGLAAHPIEDTSLPDDGQLGAPFDTAALGATPSGDDLGIAAIVADAADAAMLDDVAGLGEADEATDAVAEVLSTFDESANAAAALEESAVMQITEADVEAQPTSELNATLSTDVSDPLLIADTRDNAFEGQQEPVGDNDPSLTLGVESAVAGIEDSLVNKVTSDTSATATLDGEEIEDLGAEIDLTADMTQEERTAANVDSEHGPNDLEEIDWRDFPGDGDEEISHESTSVSGKRPRADEDELLGAEDAQDAKRLRS